MTGLNRCVRLAGVAAVLAAALGARTVQAQGAAGGRPAQGSDESDAKVKAREPGKGARDPEVLKKNLERWKSMTAEQRAEIQQRHDFLKKCSPQQRQALTQTYRSFLKLPPDQQAKLKKKLSSLPPEAQKALKKQFEKMRNNPEARAIAQGLFTVLRDVPPDRFKKLEELPPEKRGPAFRQLIAAQAQKRYVETLPPGEREAWVKKPAKEKRADVQAWFRKALPPPPGPQKPTGEHKPPKTDKPDSQKPPHREAPTPKKARVPGIGEFW